MKTIILGACLLSSGTAVALPALNAPCARAIHVRAPEDGSGVYFDRDCKVAYVLPPAIGEIRLEAIAQSAVMNQCSVLENFMQVFAVKSKRLTELASELQNGATEPPPPPQSGGGLFPAPQPAPGPGTVSDSDLEKQYDDLLDSYVKAMKRLQEFWELPAATAQFTYRVDQQKVLQEYQQLNPDIVFRAMPIHEAEIYMAREVESGGQTTPMPMVLHAEIPGFHGVQNQSGKVGAAEGVDSGEAQSGQLELSMTGACPYYDARTGEMPTELSGRALAAHMTANVRYVYELQVLKSYKAQYNLGAFVRRLQASESHGGLFFSKTINRLIENENTKDWFKIDIYSEDGRAVFDPQLAQTVKAEIIDRAIHDIGLLVTGAPIAPPTMSQPQPNGASVAAGELQKCPYVYCQVGASILDVANAIFGRSSSAAEYIHTHDTWVTESESDSSMLPFHGTVTFTPRSEE